MNREEYWKHWGTLVSDKQPWFSKKKHVIAWSIFFGGIALCYVVAIYLDYL